MKIKSQNVWYGNREIFLNIRRGEIWLVNPDPAVGAEIRKTRPVVVIRLGCYLENFSDNVISDAASWWERL
jgi:hypothetical protein